MESIIGQKRAITLLDRLIGERFIGRTLLFLGEHGVGKFTTAVELSRQILKQNPFISPDFLFYRNDCFGLKTRFFIQNASQPSLAAQTEAYFHYLLGQLSQSIALDETAIKKGMAQDFRPHLEQLLLNGQFVGELLHDKSLQEDLINLSDDLSHKQSIPIQFIRNMIDFHGHKATGKYKIGLIGNFENATVEAQNSALKLLEEPPATSIIILTASTTVPILPTILSRSVIIKFDLLGTSDLSQILAQPIEESFHSTMSWMEDNVYRYGELKKAKVKHFFEQIAPKVQYNNDLFPFIEQLTQKDTEGLVLKFLEEMIEFFRNVLLLRQQHLRKLDFRPYVKEAYINIPPKIIHTTFTSELEEKTSVLANAYSQIKYTTINPKTILPAVLLEIARWYQMRNR